MSTSETKAAFINAQTAIMLAEMEVMKAEDRERENQGCTEANGPEQWQAFVERWQPVLGYNSVVEYFRD